MKTFFNLPTDAEFFTRYASLIPTLDKLGYLAQAVSALTEFGIIYSLIYVSVDGFWPAYAPIAATCGAFVGTAFLEIGLRKFAPYSARAILYRRYHGLDRWVTGFVLAACVGLLVASGLLSFYGSKQAVEAVAPDPVLQTTMEADSTAQAARVEAANVWASDSATIAQSFAGQIEAAQLATAANVDRERAAIATLRRREQATGKRYTTRRAQLAEMIAGAKAEGAAEVARLEGLRA